MREGGREGGREGKECFILSVVLTRLFCMVG